MFTTYSHNRVLTMTYHFWLTFFVHNFVSKLLFITFVHSTFVRHFFTNLVTVMPTSFGCNFLIITFAYKLCSHFCFTNFVNILSLHLLFFPPTYIQNVCPDICWQLSFVTNVTDSQLLIPSSAKLALLQLDPATHPHVKLYFPSSSYF